MAPISLADVSITSATPGVLVKGTVDPLLNSGGLLVVDRNAASRRILDQIDAAYIENGQVAYVTNLLLGSDGLIYMQLGIAPDQSGVSIGPQLTETAEDNIYIVLFYSNSSAAWDWSVLDDSDENEPYNFSSASVTAAGPQNTSALRDAINADSSVIAMLVDSSVDGIDIANLTYEAPVTNTAPTVTLAAPTSPVDGSATQTLTGTFSDDQGNDTATITIAASLGTLGTVTKDDTAGTWEAEYTAPASTTSEQTDTVTVTATDDGALTDTASQNVTIRVTDLMPSLPPIFSQSATVGTAFSLTFSAATGGDPPLTYALSGNPAWLTLSGFTLSGTPDAAGTHQVRVTVEDDDGDTAFRQFALTVSAAADLTPSLPAIDDQTATVGTAFSLTFDAATSGDTPLDYSVSGNPAWLTLSTRTLSGTPNAIGTHTVTVTVTDDDGDTDTSSFTLTVSAAAVLLTLADFDVPSGHDEVDAALITSGLDTNGWHYNIDLSLGTVEDGSIEPEAGYEITRIRHNSANLFQLNDNPDAENLGDFFASGNGNDLTIYIQDSTGVASFVVADETVDSSGGNWTRWNVPDAFEAVMARITNGDLFILAFTRETAVTDLMPTAPTVTNKSGTVGTAFSTTLPVGTGGDTPLSYSVSGNPSWSSFNATTRVLSGTPNAAATTTVTYTVEDDDGDTDSSTFNIVVSAATPDDLMPSLPPIFSQSATVGTAFSLTFSAATGGDTPLSYSVSGNPAWLTLSNLTLSGTPTAAGTHTVTVTVTDDDGDTATRSFVLTVSAAADLMPTAGNTTNKSYAVDTDFSFTLVAGTGGDGTLAITVAGLPTGATFDGTDTITGNVSTAGTHTITATYTDDDGDTDDDTFVLTITSASTTDATTYRFENIDLSADALEDVFARFSGSLATAGAWTDRSTGVTPTSNTGPGTNSSGPYVFSESSSSSGPAEILTNSKLVMLESIMDTWTGTGRSITFRVCIQGTGWSGDDEGLRIITGTTEADSTQLVRLTGWDYSNNYVVGNTITNRQDDDYTIVQVGGWIDYTIDIPDGHEYFELASLVVASGSFHLHDLALWQITLTNGAGDVDEDLMPTLPAIADQSATVGTGFSLNFSAATGGDTPLAYSVSGNPAWLTLTDRTLSGTPTGTGTHTVTVTVEDDDGDTDSDSFVLTVSAADLMPSLPSIANQSATVGTVFSLNFNAATGGNTPLTYTVSGNPSWLTLSNRTLSGTPNATGTHTVTVMVEDDDGDADTSSFTLTVTAPADMMPMAGDTTNKSYAVDTDFSFTLVAGMGGDGTLAITVAGLPTGVTFDGTDTITGNVSTAGAHTITVTYTDDDGDTDDDTFVLTITSASTTGATTYRFENLGESTDALENVFTRFSDALSTDGSWRAQTSGTSGTSNTGPGSNSPGPYVYSETSASISVASIEANSKLVMLDSIMATWTGSGRSITLRTCVQGAGWSGDDEGLRIKTGTSEADSTDLATLSGWTYSNSHAVDDEITNRQNDVYSVVEDGGWIDWTVDVPDGHTYFEVGLDLTSSGSRHLRDVGLWQLVLTGASGSTDLMPSLPAIDDQTATVGTAFSLTFDAATSGDTPLAYSVSGNPAWLTLSTRTLSGTPNAIGTHTVIVTVTDDDGDTDTSSFTLTVSAAAVGLTLADFSVPTGNELVTAALIEAGAADFIYRDDDPTSVETSDSGEILDGDLEPAAGYRMSLVRHPAANGFIFNDRPEADSISDFFGTGGGGADLTIHVQDDTGVASFVPVDATVFASSDDFVRWDVPDDVETVLARIGTGDRLIIAFTRPTAVTDLMPTAPAVANQTGTVGTAFSVTLPIGTGGDTPLTYSVSGEPSWSSFNTTSRLLSGTPNAAATTTVTYTVTDDDGDTDSSTFNVVVSAADLMPTAPTIGNRTATVGTAYTQTLSIGTGGNSPLTYTATGLPAGLTFATSTRRITGTPTTANTYTVTYTVTDDDGDTDSSTFNIIVSAADLMPSLPGISNQSATVGTVFSLTFAAATGGDTPLTYSVSGNPSWLTLSARTLSGTPTATGTHTVTVTVTDSDNDTDSDSFVLTVGTAPNTAPTIAFTTAASTVDGESVTTISGTVTDSEDANGSITVTASTNRGTVSTPVNTNGTWTLNLTAPAVAATQRNMNVTVTAEDSGSLTDTASRAWTVRANVAPTVTITTSGGQQTGGATVDLDATVSAPETGQTVTVLWEITAGTGTLANSTSATAATITLPAETTTAQTITARITATDSVGGTDTDSVTFTIPAATPTDLMPSLPSIADQTATVGTAFSLTFNAATGGNTPLSYSVSGNPSWLTLSGLTLSGTPTAAGTPTVTVTVEDDDGDTASQSFTLTVTLDLPGVPTSVSLTTIDHDSIRLTWSA